MSLALGSSLLPELLASTTGTVIPYPKPHLNITRRSPPQTLQEYETQLSAENSRILEIIDDFMYDHRKVKDFTRTKDFENYGFLPGQQIAYGGAFKISSLTHHAIYVGEGYVAEVTSDCIRFSTDFRDQCFNLQTLADFKRRADANNSPIYLVKFKNINDFSSAVIRRRIGRLQDLIIKTGGRWRYGPLLQNCQHAATFISTGVNESPQSQSIIRAAILVAIDIARRAMSGRGALKKTKRGCSRGTCMRRILTDLGCVCETRPKRSYYVGKKYCYVNPKLCKKGQRDGEDMWDYVSEMREKELCLREDGKKYVSCDPL